jgi:hypothetical protein
MKFAEETDWKTEPMPELHTFVTPRLLFNAKQIFRMKRGVVPREMEDKWFVYWKDDCLYFHRSWTGFCIYIVRFVCDDIGGKAAVATVNRDPDQYGGTDDEYDRRMIAYLIDVLLLRRPGKFPSKSKSKSRRAIEMWGQVGRAGLGEHPDDEVN